MRECLNLPIILRTVCHFDEVDVICLLCCDGCAVMVETQEPEITSDKEFKGTFLCRNATTYNDGIVVLPQLTDDDYPSCRPPDFRVETNKPGTRQLQDRPGYPGIHLLSPNPGRNCLRRQSTYKQFLLADRVYIDINS